MLKEKSQAFYLKVNREGGKSSALRMIIRGRRTDFV